MEKIEEELFNYLLELSLLIIKKNKVEKKIKSCITCTIKNLFSCCNLTPKKELEQVNLKIKNLTLKKDSLVSIKKIRVSSI